MRHGGTEEGRRWGRNSAHWIRNRVERGTDGRTDARGASCDALAHAHSTKAGAIESTPLVHHPLLLLRGHQVDAACLLGLHQEDLEHLRDHPLQHRQPRDRLRERRQPRLAEVHQLLAEHHQPVHAHEEVGGLDVGDGGEEALGGLVGLDDHVLVELVGGGWGWWRGGVDWGVEGWGWLGGGGAGLVGWVVEGGWDGWTGRFDKSPASSSGGTHARSQQSSTPHSAAQPLGQRLPPHPPPSPPRPSAPPPPAWCSSPGTRRTPSAGGR